VAGLSLPGSENGHLPLGAMEVKAIGGEDGKLLKIEGISFLPAVQLADREMKYKAQYPLLKVGRGMAKGKTTALGTAFPMLKLEGTKDTAGVPMVKIEPKGDTKLFMEMDGEFVDHPGDIKGPKLEKKKAKTPPFSSPFALAGKVKFDDSVGMFKKPVLEFRKFAKRLQEAKKNERSGVLHKRLPGSLTKMGSRDPGELYVDDTRLGTYDLKVGLRGGEAAKVEINKKKGP
jgi:hypothetical protein